MTRDEALDLVKEHTENQNLIKHMLAVEAAMRFYAAKFDEDIDKWGNLGLLHDFDYEKMEDKHPSPWGYEILREKGVDEDVIQAIEGHAHPEDPSTRPTLMAKTLFACDEITGFIVACSLPRPNQISDLKVKSVKKKIKDKSFAKAIDRNHLKQGAEEIGIELNDHIENVISAMQDIKSELGLK